MIVTGHALRAAKAAWEASLAVWSARGDQPAARRAARSLQRVKTALLVYERRVLVRVEGEQLSLTRAQALRRVCVRQSEALPADDPDRIGLARRLAEIDGAVADGRTVRAEIDGVTEVDLQGERR